MKSVWMRGSWNMLRSLHIWGLLTESETNGEVNGRNFPGAIESLIYVMGLRFKCARMLHEGLFVHVLMNV